MDDFTQEAFGHIEFDDFADNPEPRAAVVLLVDISGSMKGERIAALNAGMSHFALALREDRLASKRVEVAVIGFGERVDIVSEFTSAELFNPQPLKANGGTPMGEGIGVALDLLAARQKQYREGGITPFRPMIFMISDGAPTDAWQSAAQRVQAGERAKSFMFYSVGVDGADMNTLSQISISAPVMLRGLAFEAMFRWLSSSLSAVSRSGPGTVVPIANPVAPGGWASVI